MKSKRLLSMLLSLTMIISCLLTTPFYAVASDVVAFENLYADSGFENGTVDSALFYHYNTQTGSVTPVYANETDGYVLKWDFSGNGSGAYSLGYIAGLSKSKKYVVKFNVRLADVDTNPESAYFYSADLSGANDQVRPKITKDGWATVYGVANNSSSNLRENVRIKIISKQTDGNSNVVNAVYEMDNLEIYDITTAKTVTFPEDVTNLTGTVAGAGSIYALPGSTVSFTYDNSGYKVESAEVADLVQNGTSYTFTMPSANATFTEVPDGEVAFENLVADPGFDGALDTNVWAMSTSAEGVITYEKDTKDDTNNVLRIDCSENTKSISYVNYKSVPAGTYYMNLKIRLAEKDATTDENHYLYAAALSGIGEKYWNVTKPVITKDGWAECCGVFTVSGETNNIGFKIINTQGDQKQNIAKAVFEIDDFVVYNLKNAQNIVAPAEVTFTSDNVVKAHNGTYYALFGSEVSFTYKKAGYALEAEGAELVKDGNTYTFAVDSSDVTISEVELKTEFENLVADPSFDGALDTNVWAMSTSAEGVITIEKDTKDETNNVLRIDCSENTKSISYVNYKSVPAGTYYMNLKIRLAEKDATTDENHYVYAAALGGIGENQYWNVTKPAINKDGWAECYGVFTVTGATNNIGFKIINTQGNSQKNVAKAVYEIDDFTVYSLENAKNIVVPVEVAFTSDNVVKSHNGTYYALSGSEVTFTYDKEGYDLSAEGAELISDGNTYTFTVDSSDVTFTEIDLNPATEFENLVVDPTFDGVLDTNVWAMSTSAEGVITIEKDTKDETNNVLRIDCSENTKSISYVNYKSVPAGTYYMNLKVRLADKDATTDENHFLYAAALGSIGNTQFWNATKPTLTKDGWAECYGVFTVTGTTNNIGFKVINTQGDNKQNIAKAVYEIDDFTIYSLENAKNISVPVEATFTSDNVIKSHDTTYYAISGNDVTFTYDGEGLEVLYMNGEVATAVDGVYTYSVENDDLLVLAVANQQNESTVKYAVSGCKPYAIFVEDATVMMLVAGYAESGALESLYSATVTATKGQQIDLSEIEEFKGIKIWPTKTIFTWGNLSNLTPIRSACELNDL
ncbi:MAG: hypothetical protein J6A61_00750 [Clostridia bacterium]|nr:hypothetical protein [Clostridia bacterium]